MQPLYKPSCRIHTHVAKQTRSRLQDLMLNLELTALTEEGLQPKRCGPLTHPQTQTVHIFLLRSENK